MPWTKTKWAVVSGTALLLVLAAVTVFVSRHKIAAHLVISRAERAIAKQIVTPVDLTANYGTPASYFPKITSFPAWGTVPTGFQVFDNVPLQIDGMMCLWGEANAKQLKIIFPEQILGIPVNQKFETLYVYHGAFFTSPDKTPIYEVVFRYADDSSFTNQVLYGADILDWGANTGRRMVRPSSPNSKLAWVGGTFTRGAKQPVCFCLTAINNPRPSVEVTSIDLYSCKNYSAGCILAMTAGRSGQMK
jgi:hypothetical protein